MRRPLLSAVLAGVVVVGFQALVLAPGSAAFGGRTDEAVTVWQHRDAVPTTGWDVWYSVIGRPSPGDPTSSLDWHASGGPSPEAASVALLPGDDKNPHVGVNEDGATVAVWQHAPGEGEAPGDWDVYWSRLDLATGAWTAPAPIAALPGDDYDPNVALDTAGNAIAVWVHRNPDGSRAIHSSVLSAPSSWSAPVSLGPSGGAASLPEVALASVAPLGGVLDRRAVAAWADAPPGAFGDHRMHYSVFDGISWTPPGEIESGATGIDVSIFDVGFASYISTDPDPFGAFGRLGITGDSSGDALVVWGGGPVILGFGSPGVVGAILDVATGTWAPMLTDFGSRFIGSGGCENPDDALTTGAGDFVGVFDFAGFIEHTIRVGGAFTFESFSYDSTLDDQRASDVAVSATEVISVNWGADPFSLGGVGPATEIIWSVGTVTPGDVTWAPAANLAPGTLGGEDMFPEIGSGFVPPALSADAYTVNLLVDGAPTPVAVRTLADARTEQGSVTNEVAEFILPGGLGEILVGRNEATASITPGLPAGGSATATSTLERASLLGGLIEAEAVSAASSTSFPPGTSSTAGSRIARLTVGDTVVEVPASAPTTVPIPGVGTLTLFEQVAAGDGATFSELEVRALHLVGTVDGLSIDLIVDSAYSGVSRGPLLTPRPPTSPAFEPGPPGAIPPIPGVGGWPPAAVPNAPCPDACYGPLPGDSVSETVPTPYGPVTVTRSRFADGDSANGSSFSSTVLSTPVGTVVVFDVVSHSSFSGGGFSSSDDDKGGGAFVSVAGLTASVFADRSESTSAFGGSQSRSDFTDASAFVSGPAGSLGVFGSYTDFASLFGATDFRYRAADVGLFYFAPTGHFAYLTLSPVVSRTGSSGYIAVGGGLFTSFGFVPITAFVPIPAPLPPV